METKTKQTAKSKRPYTICHILSSLDGKINGPFMSSPETRRMGESYGKIRSAMHADAWMYGAATTKEFTNYRQPVPETTDTVPDGDFIADAKAALYYVSIDTNGEIGWESGTLHMSGRPDSHVIEVLTESAPMSYRAYLQKRGVSYILAGKDELDCTLAMEKLLRCFAIKKMLLCGGGMVNWTFLKAGLIDELSLLLAPATDGGSGTASLFTMLCEQEKGTAIEFTLNTVERIGSGGLHLNYQVKTTM